MRRVLKLAVVLCWLGLVVVFVRRQAAPPGLADARLPAAPAGERDEWFVVERDGRRIGHAHRVTSRRAGGHAFSEELVVALAMFGVPQTLRTTLAAETDEDLALRRFRFTLASPAAVFAAEGTSDGQRLAVSYGPRGERHETAIPLREPLHLPSTLRPRVLAGDLAPGTRYAVPVLNPLTLRHEPLTVTVEGRETLAGPRGPVETVRLSEEHLGMRARVWLAGDGGVVREEGSLGFVLRRESREVVLAGMASLEPVDLAVASRIPVEGSIANARTTSRLALRVRGPAAARIPADPPRQRLAADRLSIERETLPEGVPLGAARDAGLAAYLAPGPFIESDDPAIVAAARQVAGAERDAGVVARRLVDWVHEHVEQTPSVTVPSAREVLAARRGDCNEHAVLLAALARAAGIPSRVVAGVTYLDDAFYYHAWNELWLGRWVSADAIFGQLPADATHVKLIVGGSEQHAALAGVVGQLAFAAEEAL